MKNIILAALIGFSLPVFADVPFQPTRTETEWKMSIKEFDSKIMLKDYCDRIGAATGHKEVGCTIFDPNTHTCIINVMSLQSSQDHDTMNVWGHELAHCKYGRYHTVEQ